MTSQGAALHAASAEPFPCLDSRLSAAEVRSAQDSGLAPGYDAAGASAGRRRTGVS